MLRWHLLGLFQISASSVVNSTTHTDPAPPYTPTWHPSTFLPQALLEAVGAAWSAGLGADQCQKLTDWDTPHEVLKGSCWRGPGLPAKRFALFGFCHLKQQSGKYTQNFAASESSPVPLAFVLEGSEAQWAAGRRAIAIGQNRGKASHVLLLYSRLNDANTCWFCDLAWNLFCSRQDQLPNLWREPCTK